jgi:SH3 domain-containing YSC84-like protein 1
MKRVLSLLVAAALIGLPAQAQNEGKDQERLENCGRVLKEILDIPDDIPQDLLDKATCVVVIPSVVKLAFGFSGSWGKGAMTCRTGEHYTGPWSAPAMMRLEGGGFGLQLGGQATDFVLLVMNQRGAESILSTKVKLGADAAAAAGPKGRDATAATDAAMRAEILTYSRSRGLFAGISLEGSTLRQDSGADQKVYGRQVEARDIIRKGAVPAPASAEQLLALLNKKSPKNLSESKSQQ